MLLWIASYPRSGNTFFRVLLRQVYGISTYDLHGPDANWPELEAVLGRVRLEAPISDLHADERYHIVKTHDLPKEDYPAIYLVRDGRDALVSYARFALPPEDADDEDKYLKLLHHLIETTGSYGGWSGNVQAWMARRSPTVLVRFDDLINRPLEELRRAMTAIGMEAPEPGISRLPTFGDLQKLKPEFFRKGRTGAWREEMPDDLHRLFWRRHGDTMRALGYRDAEPSPEELAGKPIGPAEPLTFAIGGTGFLALGEGWSEPEDWGTWSVDHEASLQIVVRRSWSFPLAVELGYRSFIDVDRSLQVTCRAAGAVISSWTCNVAAWCGIQRIDIPSEVVNAQGIANLKFDISSPRSPAELGLGQDTRKLGIGIEFLRLAATPG